MQQSKLESLKMAIACWKPHLSLTTEQVANAYLDIAKRFDVYLTSVELVKTQGNSVKPKAKAESRK